MKHLVCILLLLITVQFTKAQSITLVEQGQPCSIRGLSVVDDHVAWASGSKGHIALSTNGGHTWKWQQVKSFEQSDFRDIEAISDKEAIIMSSGTPALILKTTDAGTNWTVCYRNDDKACFLDGMDFFDRRHGLTMGDLIDGKFLILETNNQGKTWTILKNLPDALPGEAAFAASGTCLHTVKHWNNVVLITGGSVSRLIYGIGLKKWSGVDLALAHGGPSKGGFSLATGGGYSVMVGGDYQHNTNTDSIACYYEGKTSNKGFQFAHTMPSGYQSCVTYIANQTYLSTGTPGSNISNDGGQNWKTIDTNSFNVCQRAKHGSLVLLAGDQGKIAIFKNQ